MNRYILGTHLGSGSYGDVYLCQEKKSLRIYAMKKLKTVEQQQDNAAANEIRTLQKLQNIHHFGFPDLYEVFQDDGMHYIVYEYIDGHSLFDYITQQRALNQYIPVVPEQALRLIIKQLLFSIRFCHLQGIAHQDIKTDQIFLQENGRVVILDFGEAYNVEMAEDANYAGYCERRIGNLIFVPPEVFQDTISIRTQSLSDLEHLQFDSRHMEMCINQIKQRHQQNMSKSFVMSNLSQESIQSYKFPHLHFVQALMNTHTIENPSSADVSASDPSASVQQIASITDESVNLDMKAIKPKLVPSKLSRGSQDASAECFQCSKKWIKALTRIYQYSLVEESNAMNINAQDFRKYEQIRLQEDEFPQLSDLQRLAQQFNVSTLRAETLYKFNQRLGVDSWAIGIVIMIMLLGERPFKDLNIYESATATALLAESIKIQLEETLDQLKGEAEDFAEYAHMADHSGYRVPLGPLPNDIPLDLFLLVAGLLHPNAKVRLAVSECMECPFLHKSEGPELPVGSFNLFSIKQHKKYEEVSSCISRMNQMRDSRTSMSTFNVEQQDSLNTTPVENFTDNIVLLENTDEYTLDDDY